MKEFKIGIISDSFRLPLRDGIKKVKELGLEIYTLYGDFNGHGFRIADKNPEKIERSKKIVHLILKAGFDQIFDLYNPVVYKVADIIDTYVYRVSLLNRKYGFAAAAGLFKNIVGFILIFGTNWIIRKFSDYDLW